MLLRFSVENHRSIRDAQELLLTASPRIKPEDRRGVVFPVPGTQEQEAALPAVALYGSNASGKSNVLEALALMMFLIAKSHAERGPVSPLPQQPFLLDHDSPTRPTRLECTFTLSHAKELNGNGTGTRKVQPVYTYGFKYTKKEICEEWLYQEGTEAEPDNQLLFRRTTLDQEVILEIGDQLSGENESIRKLTRPNSLFLSAAVQNNHPQLLEIYEYFSGMVLIEKPESLKEYLIANLVDKCRDKGKLKDILKQADFGINDVTIKEIELSEAQVEIIRKMSSISSERSAFEDETTSSSPMHVKTLGFMHATADGGPRTLPYDSESRGTQVFLTLLLLALQALSKGSLLMIDELDTSLHPDLSRAFLSLFHKKTSNPHGAQLLFSTHDVTLLDSDILQQDEIWFTEKGSDGVSRLTPLTDFKLPPPHQLQHGDIEQAYRLGRFGGVPGSREFLVEPDTDQGEEEK